MSSRDAGGILSRRASLPDLDLEQRVTILEQRAESVEQLFVDELGELPNELKGAKGRGIWLALHGLQRNVQAIADDVKSLRADIERDRVAAAEKAAPWSRARWIIITAALTVTTGTSIVGIIHWLMGLHH